MMTTMMLLALPKLVEVQKHAKARTDTGRAARCKGTGLNCRRLEPEPELLLWMTTMRMDDDDDDVKAGGDEDDARLRR